MDQPIRVLVVECEPLFRRGLVSSLCAAESFTVVASVPSRGDALRLLDEHAPEVAIVGSCPSDDQPVEIAAELRRLYPAVRVNGVELLALHAEPNPVPAEELARTDDIADAAVA